MSNDEYNKIKTSKNEDNEHKSSKDNDFIVNDLTADGLVADDLIVDMTVNDLTVNDSTVNDLAVYVHYPFCLSKCPYCDFFSIVCEKKIRSDDLKNSYERELLYFNHNFINKTPKATQNLNKIPNTEKPKKISSIFFGGGTPSLMDAELVEFIIKKIGNLWEIKDNVEITLEANPTSFEQKKFLDFKKAGVNRLSIGVQSFDDYSLKMLGRKHSSEEAKLAIEKSQEIFDNVSIDLIYSHPWHNIDQWKKELKFALSFNTNHISLYQLNIEQGTEFGRLLREKKISLHPQKSSIEFLLETFRICSEFDVFGYEISNYSRKGFESMHNLSYWQYKDYIGIGPGAHSRYMNKKNDKNAEHYSKICEENPKDIKSWISKDLDILNWKKTSTLSLKQQFVEHMIVGLRMFGGIKIENLPLKLEEIVSKFRVKKLIDENLVELSSDVIKLTKNGMILHNSVLEFLLHDLL